jgi:hypothetical protein
MLEKSPFLEQHSPNTDFFTYLKYQIASKRRILHSQNRLQRRVLLINVTSADAACIEQMKISIYMKNEK